MSKGSGGGTQVQRSEPSTLQAPYLADLYQQAQQQFQAGPQQFFPDTTFARPSEETQLAELMLKDAALGQQTALSGSLFPAFQQQLMSPAQRFNDPLLQQSLAAGLRPYEESASRLLTQARRDAFGAGQGGGDRRALLESQVIGDYLTKAGDVASKFYGDIYGQGLEAQTRTLGLAPSIMDTFLSPARTIGAIGAQKEALEQKGINEAMQRFAFEQAAPSAAINQYGNIVAGSILPGTVTATTGGGGPSFVEGALGGAASGAAIGSQIGAVGGPMGALAGAILGGLLT